MTRLVVETDDAWTKKKIEKNISFARMGRVIMEILFLRDGEINRGKIKVVSMINLG